MNTASPQYLIDTQLGWRETAPYASSLISSNRPHPRFEINISQPAADWIQLAIGRIEGLTALAHGWDGYEAAPIDATVAVQALRWIMDHAYPTVPRPAIVPRPDGGIQVEWHRGGINFEIAISDDEKSAYLEDIHSGDFREGSLDESTEMFLSVLDRLASA